MKRPDFDYIVNIITKGTRVLDLGCGDGNLLFLLKQKGVRGQGIEKDEHCIYKCIERGVTVYHGDLDEGLKHHLAKSFDYVILNNTIQETRNPGAILKESLRIGKKVVVTFPNFGHWKVRWDILKNGRTPVTELLPYRWYNTPNLHFLSITDFEEYCEESKIRIEESAFFLNGKIINIVPNFFAENALFVLTENQLEFNI